MRIQKRLSQHRNDFTATIVCEACAETQKLQAGYDDAFYHRHVLPSIKCDGCGESSNTINGISDHPLVGGGGGV